jgi:hypothetical protein
MGAKQSRQQTEGSESASSQDSTLLSDSTPPSPEGAFSNVFSTKSLYDSLIQDLEAAVQEDTGWAGQDTDVVDGLYDALADLAHWKDSVVLMANIENPPEDQSKPQSVRLSEFFDRLEANEKFLSGTVRLYLREASQNLQALQALHVGDVSNSK